MLCPDNAGLFDESDSANQLGTRIHIREIRFEVFVAQVIP